VGRRSTNWEFRRSPLWLGIPSLDYCYPIFFDCKQAYRIGCIDYCPHFDTWFWFDWTDWL